MCEKVLFKNVLKLCFIWHYIQENNVIYTNSFQLFQPNPHFTLPSSVASYHLAILWLFCIPARAPGKLVHIWNTMKHMTPTAAAYCCMHTASHFNSSPRGQNSRHFVDTPDSKVHGANMGPIWGRQDPGGPHVGPMNFAIWGYFQMHFREWKVLYFD